MKTKRETILTVLGAVLVLILGQILPGCGGGGGGAETIGTSSSSSGGGGSTTTTTTSSSSSSSAGAGVGAALYTALTPGTSLPGVVAAISGVSSKPARSKPDPITGREPEEAPAVGSFLKVTFSVKDSSGNDLFNTLNFAYILVSGPTSNYQHILERRNDVLTKSVSNGSGSYTYTFTTAIPATYPGLLEHNTMASSAKGASNSAYRQYTGDLSGLPLQDGTYTVGLAFYKFYTVNGIVKQNIGSITKDFVIGNATLTAREEVLDENCNECHTSLRYHPASPTNLDHTANTVKMCVLCHVSGELHDNGTLNADGATVPAGGEIITFRSFIHRVHDSANLPSANGVGVYTNTSTGGIVGDRDYSKTPVPFPITDAYGNAIKVQFPIMPHFMSKRFGLTPGNVYPAYDKLTPNPAQGVPEDGGQMSQEKEILDGVYKCVKCHKNAAQGNAYKLPSRLACGSCHDDINWSSPYNNMGVQMPAQADDSSCATSSCHTSTGTGSGTGKGAGPVLDVVNAHTFPLDDTAINPGLNFVITGVQNQAGTDISAATGTGANIGTDNIQLTFTVKDNSGNNVAIPTLDVAGFTLAGPTTNSQAINPFRYKGIAAFDAFPASKYNFVTNGVNETNPMSVDASMRKGSPFTGNGTITRPTVSAGATKQIIAIVFKAGSVFDVLGYNPTTGATTTLAGNQATPGSGVSITETVDGGSVSFTITGGSTPFATDDRWYYEVYPPAATYTEFIPMDIPLEFLGNATGGADVFNTLYKSIYWGRQSVFEGTVTATATTLSSGVLLYGRYLPVASVVGFTGSTGTAAGDYLVINRGGATEEYGQLGYVDTANSTLRLKSALRYAHALGEAVTKVTMAKKREGSGSQYTVTDAKIGDNGQITLVAGQFTAGRPVVMTYRCRYVIPALYQSPPNDTPILAQSWGKWTGLPLQSGTYMVNIEASMYHDVGSDANGNRQRYRASTPPATTYFLIGAGATYTPRTIISSDSNCNACHERLNYHQGVYKGGTRVGYSTCMMCHSIAGVEDYNKYNLPSPYFPITGMPAETTGITVDFRDFVHKVHSGGGSTSENATGPTFKATPNVTNYVVTSDELDAVTYEDIKFPDMPDGVKNCEKCHGTGNAAYKVPADRDHPAQTTPTLKWQNVCLSCHQDNDVNGAIDNTANSADEAHVVLNTSGTASTPELTFVGLRGVEACNACHGTGTANNVDLVHKVYK